MGIAASDDVVIRIRRELDDGGVTSLTLEIHATLQFDRRIYGIEASAQLNSPTAGEFRLIYRVLNDCCGVCSR